MIHHADDWLTIYGGDCRTVLATLPDASVHCVITSPPYWGLRDYGTATWIGGSEDCDHVEAYNLKRDASGGLGGGRDLGTRGVQGNTSSSVIGYRDVCAKCAATRQDSQLGLEATPEEYVANLVAVFREVRRVLRDDGTLWLNLGDSYANTGKSGGGDQGRRAENGAGAPTRGREGEWKNFRPAPDGLKPKDLVGIPWRVAFALQADGWWLRSDIIWSKPNPMPESVTDRPTKAHEYLFLLAKRERYYFDQEAVREASQPSSIERMKHGWNGNEDRAYVNGKQNHLSDYMGTEKAVEQALAGRNLRSVWTIATRPYPGAHFAVFPPELPERCIKAGTSERGVCPDCGAPWRRVVEREGSERYATGKSAEKNGVGLATAFSGYVDGSPSPTFKTLGWIPSCAHDAEPVGAVVLDPFAGSGTVGVVANRLSRRAVLIDLNPAYLEQQMKRNAQVPLGV